eukprot:scaffold12884_cov111-Isochrysis_galbana.AAC.8
MRVRGRLSVRAASRRATVPPAVEPALTPAGWSDAPRNIESCASSEHRRWRAERWSDWLAGVFSAESLGQLKGTCAQMASTSRTSAARAAARVGLASQQALSTRRPPSGAGASVSIQAAAARECGRSSAAAYSCSDCEASGNAATSAALCSGGSTSSGLVTPSEVAAP